MRLFSPINLATNSFTGTIRTIDPECVTIETHLGPIRSSRRQAMDAMDCGDTVQLVIRPENISVVDDHSTVENQIEAKVNREVFVGSEHKLLVKPIADVGTELMIKVHSHSADAVLDRNGIIKVGWESKDCWLIHSTQNGRN
jgi:ABC-type Fe3+/spermidine/putrescine transport system ATPase subunit